MAKNTRIVPRTIPGKAAHIDGPIVVTLSCIWSDWGIRHYQLSFDLIQNQAGIMPLFWFKRFLVYRKQGIAGIKPGIIPRFQPDSEIRIDILREDILRICTKIYRNSKSLIPDSRVSLLIPAEYVIQSCGRSFGSDTNQFNQQDFKSKWVILLCF